MKIFKHLLLVVWVVSGLSPAVFADQPTFADLAVFMAKGYFRGNVSKEATLEQCAAFLNGQGVYFSLFDLMDVKAVVTQEDFARVMGQSKLLFLGKAELTNGRVKKPQGIKTWLDYCRLNDVSLGPVWDRLLERTEKGSLPEVQRFFEK